MRQAVVGMIQIQVVISVCRVSGFEVANTRHGCGWLLTAAHFPVVLPFNALNDLNVNDPHRSTKYE